MFQNPFQLATLGHFRSPMFVDGSDEGFLGASEHVVGCIAGSGVKQGDFGFVWCIFALFLPHFL